MKKLIVILSSLLVLGISAAVILSLAGGWLSDYDTIWNMQRDPVERQLTAGLSLTEGVFTGTGSGGFYGDVSVAVTVDSAGIITGLEVVYSSETPGFADPAFERLTGEILRVQSADVDVVTGATMTSRAFIAAVADAMRMSAGYDSDILEENAEEIAIEGTVFVGVGTGGYYGDIVVAVTIDEDGRIAHIEVTDHIETPGIANRTFSELIPAVIAAQCADVDIITGATYTSQAFLAAVLDALRQAE